jgi:hypothetical protein
MSDGAIIRYAASLTIASWHRWDKRRIRYWAISAHIPSTYMGEGSGSRLDVEATNDAL